MKIDTQDFNEYLSVVKTANERKNWGNMICYQFLTYTVVKINTKTASEKKNPQIFCQFIWQSFTIKYLKMAASAKMAHLKQFLL